jgi:hypothetical protein
MSDRDDKDRAFFREVAKREPEVVLPFSFHAVDAAVGRDLVEQAKKIDGRYQWTPLTHGSARHTLFSKTAGIAEFTTCALELERTFVRVDISADLRDLSADDRELLTGQLIYMLYGIAEWMNHRRNVRTIRRDAEEAVRQIAAGHLPRRLAPFTSPRGPGRPRKSANVAAWRALAMGGNKRTVFAEWAKEKGVNIDNPADEKRAWETFNRTMRRLDKKRT